MTTTNYATAIEDDDLQIRGRGAAAKFLTRRGYEILEQGWTCQAGTVDIIACGEDNELCFVTVRTSTDHLPEESTGPETRHRLEQIAIDYLESAAVPAESMVRFDEISIRVVNGSQALLRLHRNMFGC